MGTRKVNGLVLYIRPDGEVAIYTAQHISAVRLPRSTCSFLINRGAIHERSGRLLRIAPTNSPRKRFFMTREGDSMLVFSDVAQTQIRCRL